jgi:DNA-binding HxlR family transcriptional regulator
MATGLPDIEASRSEREDGCVEGASTADVLRLLGAGATGAILMALGEAPLRTKALTEQVPGYAPRTIYRHAGRLAELDVIDRLEEPGVPSKVVHRLSDPCGTELYELVNRFADATLSRLPDGRIDAHAWASLGLLADLWEAGLVEQLSCGARSPSELARADHGLSYHQVSRRTGLFKAGGLLRDWQGPGRSRCFELTEGARRNMGLVVAIARWRGRHVVAADEEGLTEEEMATALRASLPLVELTDHQGRCLQLMVAGKEVWAEIEADGFVQSCTSAPAEPASRALGEVEDWATALLDGESGALRFEGEARPLADLFEALYDRLWMPRSAQ